MGNTYTQLSKNSSYHSPPHPTSATQVSSQGVNPLPQKFFPLLHHQVSAQMSPYPWSYLFNFYKAVTSIQPPHPFPIIFWFVSYNTIYHQLFLFNVSFHSPKICLKGHRICFIHIPVSPVCLALCLVYNIYSITYMQ